MSGREYRKVTMQIEYLRGILNNDQEYRKYETYHQ